MNRRITLSYSRIVEDFNFWYKKPFALSLSKDNVYYGSTGSPRTETYQISISFTISETKALAKEAKKRNARNGTTSKTVRTDFGKLQLDIPFF